MYWGWSDGGIASAPRALTLLARRSLRKRWQQPSPMCLPGVRAAPGCQCGLVPWLLLERSVTWEGGDDCSMAAVSPASLNLGRRRGKVVGEEGRAAQSPAAVRGRPVATLASHAEKMLRTEEYQL